MEFYLLMGACVSSTIGWFIGRTRGRESNGALISFLFGPAGWIAVLLLPPLNEPPRPSPTEPPPLPTARSSESRLREADDLLAKGLISGAEHAEMRRKILGL